MIQRNFWSKGLHQGIVGEKKLGASSIIWKLWVFRQLRSLSWAMLKEIAATHGLANGPWMDIYGNIQLFVTGAPCLSCVRMLMGSKDAILLFATIRSKFCQTSEVGAMWQFHLLMPNAVGSENGKNVWSWAGHLIISVEFLVCNCNGKMDFHFHDSWSFVRSWFLGNFVTSLDECWSTNVGSCCTKRLNKNS